MLCHLKIKCPLCFHVFFLLIHHPKSQVWFLCPPFFRILSNIQTHMLHAWNIYQHLPHKSPKCRSINHTRSIRERHKQKQHAPHSENFIAVPLAMGAARAAPLLRLGRLPATSHPPPCAIRDACGYQYRPQMRMVTMVPVAQNKGIPGRSLCFFQNDIWSVDQKHISTNLIEIFDGLETARHWKSDLPATRYAHMWLHNIAHINWPQGSTMINI